VVTNEVCVESVTVTVDAVIVEVVGDEVAMRLHAADWMATGYLVKTLGVDPARFSTIAVVVKL
jgi:hypothetical protein